MRKVLDEQELTIDGVDIRLVRSRVKRFNMRIVDSVVRISYPAHKDASSAIDFFYTNKDWVDKVLSREQSKTFLFDDGEQVALWGKAYTLKLVPSNKKRVSKVYLDGDTLVMELPEVYLGASIDASTKREQLYKLFLAQELEREIPDHAAHYEQRMGKSASVWKVRYMKSRWGSCNTKSAAITLSSALAEYPKCCMEQTIVHELCHLFVRSHNRDFYALMDRYYPEWKTARARLRKGPLE